MRRFLKAAAVLFAAVLFLTACSPTRSQNRTSSDLQVTFFDAGKADAILLTTENSTVLIDTGEKGFGKTILSDLEEKGIQEIDVLILTHFDQDHIGGAAKILSSIPVHTILTSNVPKDSEEYSQYLKALDQTRTEPLTVRETYEFTLDGIVYSIDPPRKTDYSDSPSNNSSLIISVTDGDTRFLFAGDAESERLEEFIESEIGTCDVLKVPHHGKEEPLLEELLKSVKPSYAVITSSEEEMESEEVTGLLRDYGIKTLLTRKGTVIFRCDGTDLSVLQE